MSADRSARRLPALEFELRKGPDGRIRYFRFTIGAVAVGMLVLLFTASTQGHGAQLVEIIRLLLPLR